MKKLISTPVGRLYVWTDSRGLLGACWTKPLEWERLGEKTSESVSYMKAFEAELKLYFSGELEDFQIPVSFRGTDFQKKVWKELQKIPYGKTISYKELAERVGSPKAFRAVGTANGKNLFSIVVPCHRVIASDSTLGGYAGGLEVKQNLLDLEKFFLVKHFDFK